MFKRYTQHPYANTYQDHQESETGGEAKLAYALIIIAIQDWLEPDTKIRWIKGNKNILPNVNKASALKWLLDTNTNYVFSFVRCCELLNLPPNKTRTVILNNGLKRSNFFTARVGKSDGLKTSHARRTEYAQDGISLRKRARLKANKQNQ